MMYLRAHGTAVVLLAHTGKDPTKGVRGASKLIDLQESSIRLDPVKDEDGKEIDDCAAFKISRHKKRHKNDGTPFSAEAKLEDLGGNEVRWHVNVEATGGSKLKCAALLEFFEGWEEHNDQPPTQKEMKKALGKNSDRAMAKLLEEAQQGGFIEPIEGKKGKYQLSEYGRRELEEF